MRRTIAVLAMVAVAACGREAKGAAPDASADATGKATAVVPTTSITSPEHEVLVALDGFINSTIAVNDPPDPGHPDLARFRTGAVLANALDAVGQNRQLGIAYRLPAESVYGHQPTISQVSDNTALVRNCLVDDAQQVAVSSGLVLNSSVATKLFETTLVREEGIWKVAENAMVKRWEGVATCDA
jgi:hypothetical protein